MSKNFLEHTSQRKFGSFETLEKREMLSLFGFVYDNYVAPVAKTVVNTTTAIYSGIQNGAKVVVNGIENATKTVTNFVASTMGTSIPASSAIKTTQSFVISGVETVQNVATNVVKSEPVKAIVSSANDTASLVNTAVSAVYTNVLQPTTGIVMSTAKVGGTTVADVGLGFYDGGKDLVVSVYNLAKDAKNMTIGWVTDPAVAKQASDKWGNAIQTITKNPTKLVTVIVDQYKSEYQKRGVAGAVGYGIFDVGTLLIGAGEVKAAVKSIGGLRAVEIFSGAERVSGVTSVVDKTGKITKVKDALFDINRVDGVLDFTGVSAHIESNLAHGMHGQTVFYKAGVKDSDVSLRFLLDRAIIEKEAQKFARNPLMPQTWDDLTRRTIDQYAQMVRTGKATGNFNKDLDVAVSQVIKDSQRNSINFGIESEQFGHDVARTILEQNVISPAMRESLKKAALKK